MLNDLNVFLLDMDGTVYLGDTLIDGAKDFLDTLKSLKKNYIFVTNNSSKSPEAYIKKLSGLGITIDRNQIFTSADATIFYLKEHTPDIKNIFLLGTPSLKEQFLSYGYNIIEKSEELNELFKQGEKIDEIILGFDTTLTYEKMHTALVFSGETTRAMYDNSNIAATYTYDSVKEIDKELRKFL